MRRGLVFLGVLVLVLGSTVTAIGASRAGMNVSFFVGGGGTPGWSRDNSSDGDWFSMKLDVPDTSAYAGIYIHRTSDTLPTSEPGFEQFQTGTVSGPVRLVIASTDGCYAYKYVYPFATDAWVAANQWDRMGSCGYGYNVQWSGVQAAFTGKSVAAVYVVSDSYSGGSVTWIDELTYDGKTFSRPSDNAK